MPSKALVKIDVESNKAEQQLRQFQRELDKLKGNMSQLSAAAGINVASLTKMGGALALVSGASKVVKEAFMQMETRADAFERTMAGAKAGYETFLSTINGGNWSNFLQNFSSAVQGARDLADALDRLDSIKGNNAPAIASLQETIQQLRTRQDAGENVGAQISAAVAQLQRLQSQSVTQGKNVGRDMIIEAVTNGYQSMRGAGVLSKSSAARFADEYLKDGQDVMDKYAAMYKTLEKKGTKMATVWQNVGISTAGIPITQQVTKEAFNLKNLSKQEQIQYNFAKAVTEYEKQIRAGGAVWESASQEGRSMYREQHKGNVYALKGASGDKKKTAEVPVEGSIDAQEAKVKKLTEAWKKAADDDSRTKMKKQVDEATQELDRMMGKTKEVEWTPGTSGFNKENISAWTSMMEDQLKKADFGTPIYNSIKENMKDMSSLTSIMQEAMKRGLDVKSLGLEDFFEQIFDGENIPDDTFKDLVDKLNQAIKEGLEPLEFDVSTGGLKPQESLEKYQKEQMKSLAQRESRMSGNQKFAEDVGNISQLVGGVNQIASGIEQLGIDLPQGVHDALNGINGMISILSGISTILIAIEMLQQIHTARSMIPFFSNGGIVHAANGIIVPGNSWSGDRVPAMVNSGELILNRAQQDNIASQLEGINNGGGGTVEFKIRGDVLYGVLNNYGKMWAGHKSLSYRAK